MPRLKLPAPDKRKALFAAAAARVSTNGHGAGVALVKAGYAMALRHVHVIRNKEARARMRQMYRRHDDNDRMMSDPAICRCRTCKTNRGEK